MGSRNIAESIGIDADGNETLTGERNEAQASAPVPDVMSSASTGQAAGDENQPADDGSTVTSTATPSEEDAGATTGAGIDAEISEDTHVMSDTHVVADSADERQDDTMADMADIDADNDNGTFDDTITETTATTADGISDDTNVNATIDGQVADGTNVEETKPQHLRKFRHRQSFGRIAAVAAVAALICGGTYCAMRTSQARAAEADAIHTVVEMRDDLDDNVVAAHEVLKDASADKVQDVADYDALVKQCDVFPDPSGDIDEPDPSPVETNPFDYARVEQSVDSYNELAIELRQQSADVKSATTGYQTAVHKKAVADATEALKVAIEAARKNAEDNAKKVQDTKTVEQVKAQADEMQALIDGGSDDVEQLKAKASEIKTASQKVTESHEVWQKEQVRLAAVKKAQQATGSGANISASGAWVPYVVWYTGYDVPHGGATLYRWRTRYYLAHSTDAAGRMIASKPARVTVDGQTYHYVSTKIVDKFNSTEDDVLPFSWQNGGVGFQTCNGDGVTMQVNHYEPDN